MNAEGMISDIRQNEYISWFTQNPLLLTAVCILYQDGKRIPEQGAELYNRVIGNLISRRFHERTQPGREKEVLEFLMSLAFDNQKENRKTIEISNVLGILKKTFPQKTGERRIHYQRGILELFKEIEPKCGLFDCLSSGEFEFTHSIFQEFLAAKHMVYMDFERRQLGTKCE